MIRRILLFFRLVPLSVHRATLHECAELHFQVQRAERKFSTVEASLWARYQNRLKNDVSMSLSWFYTEHCNRVSLGTAAPSRAAETWPYYPAAQFLLEPPRFKPEQL
jgi:hypothetical protein